MAIRTAPAAVLEGLAAKHPLGRLPDVPLRFHRFRDRFVSDAALPAGRWHVQLTIARGADRYRIVETLS